MRSDTEESGQPTLVRVKRRRHDPSPGDLVVEAKHKSVVSPTSPAALLATLTLSAVQPSRKRRKFQLVTTTDDNHALSTDDFLLKLHARRDVTQEAGLGATIKPELFGTGSSGAIAGVYRQIHGANTVRDAFQQSFRVYDLVHEAANQACNQLFRGPDEAEIMAHYYPLVQSYLQQQGQQQPQLPAEDNHDFVFDYYAMADSDQTDAEPVTANVPIIQVHDDEQWQGNPDAISEADQSEDSNAEDWYGNDYPEDDESIASDQSGPLKDDDDSSDD